MKTNDSRPPVVSPAPLPGASGATALAGRFDPFQILYDFMLILRAEFYRDLIFMKRYPLEPISFLFFMFMILIAILGGIGTLVNSPDGKIPIDQAKMILGYCLMQFVMSAQMGWSGQISNESQTGTLEQLSISGHSLGGVLLSRGVSQFPRHILSFFILLGAFAYVRDVEIFFAHALLSIPVLFCASFGIFGVAYLFAGATLLFKRVGFFFQIVNFGFLGLFWLKRENWADGSLPAVLYDIFPLTVGMQNLQDIFIKNQVPDSPVRLVITSLASWALGYLAFRWMERKAREYGLLSQY